MKIFHIQVFMSLVNTGDYADAAKECYVSERRIKQIIKSLEEEMHTRLFYSVNGRGGRQSLTKGGEVFLEYAKEVLTCYDNIISDVRSIKESGMAPSRFCIDAPLYGSYLNGIRAFCGFNEGRLRVTQGNAKKCVQSLLSGEVDACLVRMERQEHRDFEAVPLDTNALAVVVSQQNYLSRKKKVAESDLLRGPLGVPVDYEFRFAPSSREFVERITPIVLPSFKNLQVHSLDGISKSKRMALAFYPDEKLKVSAADEVIRVVEDSPHLFCDYFCYKKDTVHIKELTRLCDYLRMTKQGE